MKDLLDHWSSVSPLVAQARLVCVFTDYDGTITPLVDRPERAVLDVGARTTLQGLAANPRALCGVVSGRSIADLRQKLGLDGIWYVGNHGFEIQPPARALIRFYEDDDARLVQAVHDQLAAAMDGIPGVILENKGPIVAVHYRTVGASDLPRVEAGFLKVLAAHRDRIMMGRGKLVWEARLRGNCSKGTALRFIRRELPMGARVFYFGDDVTDRDAFRALRGLGITVQVGSDDAGLADYTLAEPRAVLEVLQRIDAETRAREAPRSAGTRSGRREPR